MKITAIAAALPPVSNTGWGVASKRITEELGKLTWVMDLRTSAMLQSDVPVDLNVPVLQAVSGPQMTPMYPQVSSSVKRVGYSFIEDIDILRVYAGNAARYFDHVVCGSTWARDRMREVFQSQGITVPVFVAIQGVDSSIFKPDPERTGHDPNWFTIWSAGKFEYRKSQDVVIKAVGILMKKYPDVRLFTAWSNPWPASRATMARSPHVEYSENPGEDMLAVKRCCQPHLDMERTYFYSQADHGFSAGIINTCDVGLFLSRCEAGTNLPLMEAMACGLPVIATGGTGHKDVITMQQKLYSSSVIEAWEEPDVDEVVTTLEWFYRNRNYPGMRQYREKSTEAVAGFTWEKCAQSILEACQ